jgi:hypothetical protein
MLCWKFHGKEIPSSEDGACDCVSSTGGLRRVVDLWLRFDLEASLPKNPLFVFAEDSPEGPGGEREPPNSSKSTVD